MRSVYTPNWTGNIASIVDTSSSPPRRLSETTSRTMLEGGPFSVCDFLLLPIALSQMNRKDYVATRLYPQNRSLTVTCQAATRLLHTPTTPCYEMSLSLSQLRLLQYEFTRVGHHLSYSITVTTCLYARYTWMMIRSAASGPIIRWCQQSNDNWPADASMKVESLEMISHQHLPRELTLVWLSHFHQKGKL